MNSIIIKHTSEFSQSKLGQRLDETMIECLKATATVNDKMGIKLATLLKINDLPRDVVMILTRPWYRANMLASWFEQHDLPTAKERAKEVIDTVKEFKRLLTADSTEASLILMLLLTSNELNMDRLLFDLDDVQSFFEFFTKIDFDNSSEYSINFLRRYALNSLILMGKKMGLNETGKPTQLNQYLQIVTDRVYKEIGKDNMKFREIDFPNSVEQNTLLLFIHNPYCKITNSVLSKINNRFFTV
jgi:hypothetical protein